MPGLTGKDEDIALKRNFHEYISIFSTGSKHFFYTYFNWLFLNKITFAFILLSIVLMYPFSKNNFIKSINKTHILFILLILFTASLIIVLTFYSIRNVNLYPNRIYNFINWIFIALTLAIIPIFIHKINFISNNFIQKYKHQLLMFFLFYIFFQINLSTNNFTIIRNDFISKKLSSFNDRITKRYNTYIYPESIGQWKIIYTDTLLLIPDIYIDFLYITPNKKEKWDNDYAAYFKADEIMLQGDTISNKNEIKKKLNELSAQR